MFFQPGGWTLESMEVNTFTLLPWLDMGWRSSMWNIARSQCPVCQPQLKMLGDLAMNLSKRKQYNFELTKIVASGQTIIRG